MPKRWGVIALVAIGVVACGASVGAKKLSAHAARAGVALKELLVRESNGKAINVSEREGAFGTTVVTAEIAGAYPGSGVASLVMDKDGKSFGSHGDRPLADLMRLRGFLKAAPEIEPFVRLLNDGQYEGMMTWDAAQPHSMVINDGVLEARFSRRTFPSQSLISVIARLRSVGPIEIEERSNEQMAATAALADPVAATNSAIDGKRFNELLGLIPKLKVSTDPRARAALASATTTGNDTVTGDALTALGTGPEAVRVLRDAWKPLDAAKRAALVQFASDLAGPAFAALLR